MEPGSDACEKLSLTHALFLCVGLPPKDHARFAVQAWNMLVVVDVSKRGRGIVSAHSGPVACEPTPRHFLTSFFPFFLSLVFGVWFPRAENHYLRKRSLYV